MNKTGARLLGFFAGTLIGWLWNGWGAPATGVQMSDGLLTALGPACVVVVEWLLVREQRGAR